MLNAMYANANAIILCDPLRYNLLARNSLLCFCLNSSSFSVHELCSYMIRLLLPLSTLTVLSGPILMLKLDVSSSLLPFRRNAAPP
jgi:hypothetical protein